MFDEDYGVSLGLNECPATRKRYDTRDKCYLRYRVHKKLRLCCVSACPDFIHGEEAWEFSHF